MSSFSTIGYRFANIFVNVESVGMGITSIEMQYQGSPDALTATPTNWATIAFEDVDRTTGVGTLRVPYSQTQPITSTGFYLFAVELRWGPWFRPLIKGTGTLTSSSVSASVLLWA
jgi:hypothetical protein